MRSAYSTRSCCSLWYQRNKSGVTTQGSITSKFIRNEGDDSGGKKHMVTYTFRDDRPEITTEKLYNVLQNFCYSQLPNDIITLCMEYIGLNSIIFWYGPFEQDLLVSEENYKKYKRGDDITVKYEASLPYNNSIAIGDDKAWLGMWIALSILVYGSVGGVIYVFVEVHKQRQGEIIASSSLSFIAAIISISCCYWHRRKQIRKCEDELKIRNCHRY